MSVCVHGGGGGFNEYKYNLSFQNLIQLKSRFNSLFFCSTATTYVRLLNLVSLVMKWQQKWGKKESKKRQILSRAQN